jgi:putative tryptophan/tyrosine transport system substrate-binding protein
MRRREFIKLLGGAVSAWPLAARAQQPATPVIGFLNIASPEAWTDYVSGFKQGLGQTGFIDGQNVAIEYRWARGDYSRLPVLANELVDRRVSVIAANGGARSALAARPQHRAFLLYSPSVMAIRKNTNWWRASVVPATTSPA